MGVSVKVWGAESVTADGREGQAQLPMKLFLIMAMKKLCLSV